MTAVRTAPPEAPDPTSAAPAPAPPATAGRRLRVLHVVLSLNPGGAERLVIDLSLRSKDAFDVSVCCLDERGAWARELDDAGIPVHVLGREPGFHPMLGRRLARLAASARADVLHCHQYTPFVYGCAARLFRPGMHLVFTEHGRLAGATVSAKRRLANRLLGRVPGKFFAVCDELRRFLLEEGFPASKLGVLYNGIDAGAPADAASRARARAKLALPDDAFVIGSVARLDRVKDLPTLLAAFDALRRGADGPPPRLVLVGDGPERDALHADVAARGLDELVHFTGARTDVRELLPGFDAYVNSSTYEGVSLTIVEAMAAGLPVVATRVGGTPEVLEDGADGRLVPSGDPDAMADALRDLQRSPDAARALGDAARRTVLARFRFDHMLAAYADAYRAGGNR